jgi:hypothetical protein
VPKRRVRSGRLEFPSRFETHKPPALHPLSCKKQRRQFSMDFVQGGFSQACAHSFRQRRRATTAASAARAATRRFRGGARPGNSSLYYFRSLTILEDRHWSSRAGVSMVAALFAVVPAHMLPPDRRTWRAVAHALILGDEICPQGCHIGMAMPNEPAVLGSTSACLSLVRRCTCHAFAGFSQRSWARH